jgi:ribonuclease HI
MAPLFPLGKQKGKEQGPGCWNFIVHGTGVEVGGWVSSSTNNPMELQAVIAAIKSVDPKNSIIIRTDSQYVTDAISGRTIFKTNSEFWREYEEVSRLRRVMKRPIDWL